MKEGKRPNSRKRLPAQQPFPGYFRIFASRHKRRDKNGRRLFRQKNGRVHGPQGIGAEQPQAAGDIGTVTAENRSHRGYDTGFVVREDQLRRMIEVNTRIPSARNQQVLRFRPVLADEAHKVLPHIRLGGALPALRLPFRVPSRMPLSSSARQSKRTATSTWIWASRPRACCSRQRRSA